MSSSRFSAQRGGLVLVVWLVIIVLVYLFVAALRPSPSPYAATTPGFDLNHGLRPFAPAAPAVPSFLETPAEGEDAPPEPQSRGSDVVHPSLSLYSSLIGLASAVDAPASKPAPAPKPAAPNSGFYDHLVARSRSTPPDSPAALPHAPSHTDANVDADTAVASRVPRGLSAIHSASAHARALSSERSRLCGWWGRRRNSALTLVQQVLGDVVNLVLDLNFEFTTQRAPYIAQLEHWRGSKFSRPLEARSRGHDCRAVCSARAHPTGSAHPASGEHGGGSAHAAAPGAVPSAAELTVTNAFRQALIECILCETAQIELNSRCDAKDMTATGPDVDAGAAGSATAAFADTGAATGASAGAGAEASPEHLRAAFAGLYEPSTGGNISGGEPFFINSPLEQTFGTFITLLSTFAYAPAQLQSFFPLPSDQVEVSVPRTRAYTRWLLQQQHAAFKSNGSDAHSHHARAGGIETVANAGLGGGMGVQLLCRPAPDAAPVVLLSAGGGGGRGYGLGARSDTGADAGSDASADAGDGAGGKKSRRQRKKLSHELAEERTGPTAGALYTLPFASSRHATFNAGSGGGLQVNSSPFARHRTGADVDSAARAASTAADADAEASAAAEADAEANAWDLIAGGGGGGSVTITDDRFSESHGSQPDQDTHLPFAYAAAGDARGRRAGVARLRRRLYGAMRDCLLHGPDAELVVSGGGGAGSGAQLSVLKPAHAHADTGAGPAASAAAPVLASVYFGAELGFGFSLPIPHAWFTASPVATVVAESAHAHAEKRTGKHAGKHGVGTSTEDALAEAIVSAGVPHRASGAGGAPNPTPGSLARLQLSRFAPVSEDPYALSAVASVCVASCVAHLASGTSPADSAPAAGSADAAGTTARGVAGAGALSSDLPELMSTGTGNTKSLFYAHCVCPCLQRHLQAKPWAGYLSCRDLALGTFDRSTAGHVDSVVDEDTVRVERALAAAAAPGSASGADTGTSTGAGRAEGEAPREFGDDGVNARRIRNGAWGWAPGGSGGESWRPIPAADRDAPLTHDSHG